MEQRTPQDIMEELKQFDTPTMREVRLILQDLGFPVLSMKEAGVSLDIEENGTTFAENAMIKARETVLPVPPRKIIRLAKSCVAIYGLAASAAV